MRDGFVYFGCKQSIKQIQTNMKNEQTTIVSSHLHYISNLQLLAQKQVVNDSVIPNKNQQTAEQHLGRYCQIHFDHNSYGYFIKDL
jgi:hypothetical protein